MSVSSKPPEEAVARDRVRRLARLADALSGVITVDEVVRAVVDAGAEALMADSVAVCLLDETGTTYEIAASGGLRGDMAQTWASFPADAPVPVTDAVQGRELVVIEGVEERERRYPVFGTGPITSDTLLVAPMLLHGTDPVGALSVGFAERRPLHDVDRDFVQAAADLCGQAVHRARLFEYQQRTLARQRFLARASAALSRDLDHQRTLADVATLVTEELADVCAVCLYEGDALVPVVAVHREPSGQEVVDALVRRQPTIRNERLLEVARTGEAVFMPIVTPADSAEDTTRDEAHLQLVRALDVTSAMVVPLRARDDVLGILLLMMTSHSGRTFADDDRELADDLAGRAALAIDNARLFNDRDELVQHLQVALGSHRAIEQAKGILARRWATSPPDAFDRMRQHARSRRRRIEEVAEDVVAGRDDLQP